MGKRIVILILVFIILFCVSTGCAKIAKSGSTALPRAIVKGISNEYSDQNTLNSGSNSNLLAKSLAKTKTSIDYSGRIYSDQINSFELKGISGTRYNINYKGNTPADILILSSIGKSIYDNCLNTGKKYLGSSSRVYRNVLDKKIEFTLPDAFTYYIIIDNTNALTGGAYSGKILKYTLKVS